MFTKAFVNLMFPHPSWDASHQVTRLEGVRIFRYLNGGIPEPYMPVFVGVGFPINLTTYM